MKTRNLIFQGLALLSLFAFGILLTGISVHKNRSAVQWQPWEDSLTIQKTQTGRPAEIVVQFRGPNNQAFKNPAFTDDGRIYRFRAAFPVPGKWRWEASALPPGSAYLKKIKGTVKVISYSGENPLYRHGDLRVSPDARYLIHEDGKPFLWIGDTGWKSTILSTMDEWKHYADTRASQKFSVIQVSPKGTSKNPAKDLAAISLREDGTIDPMFWKDLEKKITYANDKGMVVLMVGISKVWSDEFSRNQKNQLFESYITGRLAPYKVIFSPSFDQLFDRGNDSVAVELNKLTAHMVTQHPGTNYDANLQYRNALSTDFCGMQSGHHGGNVVKAYNAARQWTLDMWNCKPVKPVINIEAMYDAYGDNNAKNWREKDVRKLGWISWLSGSKGYTYGAGDVPPKVPKGAGGVWRFNTDPTAYDFWGKAIHWPSAHQMTLMHDFFEPLPWWKLEPAHGLIMNQENNDTLKMVASATPDKKLLIAYLPDNPSIELDLSGLSGNYSVKWFNPVAGITLKIESPVDAGKKVLFKRPDGFEDAVLSLEQ